MTACLEPRRRRVFSAFVAAPAAAAAVALLAPGVADAYTDQQAVADLNAWRAEVGVPAVTGLDAEMSAACAQHNRYMAQNGLTHDEEPGKPGYSPRGAAAGPASVISSGEGTPRALWEAAVYHRMPLLDPRERMSWFAANDGFSCMGIGRAVLPDTGRTVTAWDNSPGARTAGLVAYTSPANGAREVPTAFASGETPDPREAIPGRPSEPGWLLSVDFNGPWEYNGVSRVTAASLTPDGRTPVAITPQDTSSVNGLALGGGVAIFPHRPLMPRTWYTATVAGTKGGRNYDPGTGTYPGTDYPFSVTWRFQTAAGDGGAAARTMRLSVTGKLRGRKLALKVGAGTGARGRRASVRLHTPKRTCKRRRGYRRSCRTTWRAVGRKKAVKLSRASIKRNYKVSRRSKRIRATVTVGAYRSKVGQRWKTTTAKRTVRRRR